MRAHTDHKTLASWRSLIARVRPHRSTLAAAVVLGLVGAAGGLAQPLAAREVIEALAADRSLLVPLLVLGALVAVSAFVLAAHLWVLARTAERVVLDTRREVGWRLLRLRMPAFDTQAPGDLVARATSDSTLLGSVVSIGLVESFNGAVTLLGAIVLMAVVDPVLLAVTAVALAVTAGGVGVVLPRISRTIERRQAAVGELGAVLERALGALKTVKASGAEGRETAAVKAVAESAYRRGMESAGYQAIVGTATALAVQVAFLAVLGVGGARAASGSLSIGDLIAFLLYLFFLSEPISALGQGATQLQQGLAAVSRIDALHELPLEEDLATSGRSRLVLVDDPLVVFEGVSFRYVADAPLVLDHVSFAVPRRGLTAVVGPSGAGKTTLFSLLERFYEPQHGHITLGGSDLRNWSRAELRASIGYVEQEAPVLAGTLRDNLRYGAPDAGDDELTAVLRQVRLAELLSRLPDGLDTGIGTRGSTLSGGERQRIAIARALLQRPSLLILDEAASQLDGLNEVALRDIIAETGRNQAVLVIAHRLSTVVDAQRIIVLEAGRVRAVGTHRQLIASDGLYAELAATQLPSGLPGQVLGARSRRGVARVHRR